LLRLGEANHAPLPPPPEPGSKTQSKNQYEDHPPAASDADAAAGTATAGAKTVGGDTKPQDSDAKSDTSSVKKKKKGSRFLGFIKGTTKVGVETVLGADHLKARVGSEQSKSRRGILHRARRTGDGPTEFQARHHGKKGLFLISTTATTPCCSFEKEPLAPGLAPEPVFSIALDDIAELKKVRPRRFLGQLLPRTDCWMW